MATARVAKIAKPTGSKLVKGPAESEKFVWWKSMKNSVHERHVDCVGAKGFGLGATTVNIG
jgi:hypothetical protein